jgi:nitroimidazol reductase NimA-like FMN-containing flavoprotein (pyridoxamine 5'-phosphate oxidase superfamily)
MIIFKMPSMEKSEYDTLIEEEYICRIAFKGESHPYIAPFLYIFDGKFMYFLSTKYGKKLQHFKQNPSVTVEVEKYTPDLSNFAFVALSGRLEEVQDPEIKNIIRQKFVGIKRKIYHQMCYLLCGIGFKAFRRTIKFYHHLDEPDRGPYFIMSVTCSFLS